MSTSYRQHLHLIREQIKDNLPYSFVYLSTVTPDKVWKIERSTLWRARKKGELVCNNTIVTGEWFLDWCFKTPEQRRAFAQSSIGRQLRKGAARW